MGRGDHAAEHERRYQELRLRVQQQASVAARALDDAAPGPAAEPPAGQDGGTALLPRPEYSPEAEAAAAGELAELVTAADELLAFVDRLPVLADLPARALSVQVVRAAAFASLLGAVLLGLGVWRGLLGTGWVVAAVLGLVAAAAVARAAVAPAAGRHLRQRWTAALAGVAGLACGPAAAVWGWRAGVPALLVQLAAVAVLREGRLPLRRGGGAAPAGPGR